MSEVAEIFTGQLALVISATFLFVFAVDKFAFNDRLPTMRGYRKAILPLLSVITGSFMFWLLHPASGPHPITFYGMLLGAFTSTSYKILIEAYRLAVAGLVPGNNEPK